MNLTFFRLSAIVILLTSVQSSHAAGFAAKKSGFFSDTATWYGNVVPPTTLGANSIIIPSGINVSLDRDIILNDQYSEIEFFSGGTPGKIISTTKNHISVNNGNIFGFGTIDIDSMYVGIPDFWMSGTLNVNKLTLNGTEMMPTYSIQTNIRKELRLAGGTSKFIYSSVTVALDSNADLVYGGGILATVPNSLDLSKGYNLRYTSISYVHNTIKNVNTLNEFEVAVGAGNTLRLTADVFVPKKLLLTSGSLKTDGYTLTFGPNAGIEPGGNGNITGTNATRIVVQSTQPQFGVIRFSGSIGNFEIQSNTNVELGTDLFISNSISLQSGGRLQLNDNNVILSPTSTFIGGSATSYILTNAKGQLKQHIPANGNKVYPVGTEQHYAPVTLGNNAASNYSDIGVSVSDKVFSHGTTGFDLANTFAVVNSSWTVSGSISNVDLSIEPLWSAANEKNGFDATACFVSHYTNGAWDVLPGTAATITGAQKSIRRSPIHNFGVFTVADNNTRLSIHDKTSGRAEITVYPNPATDNIRITCNGDGVKNATIFDMSGRAVKTFPLEKGTTKIDISTLSNGIYHISCNGHTNSLRFVKN